MASKPDDIFIIGEEALGDISEPADSSEHLSAEQPPPVDPASAPAAPPRAPLRRIPPRALAAATLGLTAAALLGLAGRGADPESPRQEAEGGEDRTRIAAPSIQPAVSPYGAARARPQPSRSQRPGPGMTQLHTRSGGPREREPTQSKAPTTPPPDATATVPTLLAAPQPTADPPAPPSLPPSPGGGSGRRPEFSFER